MGILYIPHHLFLATNLVSPFQILPYLGSCPVVCGEIEPPPNHIHICGSDGVTYDTEWELEMVADNVYCLIFCEFIFVAAL